MKKLSLAAAVLAAVTLGLTGCGGGQTEPKTLTKDEYDKALKYAQCMRKYGLEVPVPDPDGRMPAGVSVTADPNDPKTAAARAACGRLAPPAHSDGKPPQEMVDHALKTAECLRRRGIDAKDPRPGEIGLTVDEAPGDTPEKIRAAFAACDREVPAPRR
ncbi:hypothetical protein [Streptosporangium carneum]|uniref:Secreted protein n=1 Tax=Streptosporangium carneum TaxID=47481 RepID=A0A9W6HVU7_9ACTN|nr:hypothetical protein [Streptosporangium carneum]GLK06978.1 hypothetical protein GCM10017600_03830 [Streptosporangium carneum]